VQAENDQTNDDRTQKRLRIIFHRDRRQIKKCPGKDARRGKWPMGKNVAGLATTIRERTVPNRALNLDGKIKVFP
jgi:hypothetical protein